MTCRNKPNCAICTDLGHPVAGAYMHNVCNYNINPNTCKATN